MMTMIHHDDDRYEDGYVIVIIIIIIIIIIITITMSPKSRPVTSCKTFYASRCELQLRSA
jgi:hypothetical protein